MDGDWQFFGEESVTEEEAAVLSLKEIMEMDPTIQKVLDIPKGTEAQRKSISDNWINPVYLTAPLGLVCPNIIVVASTKQTVNSCFIQDIDLCRKDTIKNPSQYSRGFQQTALFYRNTFKLFTASFTAVWST